MIYKEMCPEFAVWKLQALGLVSYNPFRQTDLAKYDWPADETIANMMEDLPTVFWNTCNRIFEKTLENEIGFATGRNGFPTRKIVAIEGIDGAGKSTFVGNLKKAYLRRSEEFGKEDVVCKVPANVELAPYAWESAKHFRPMEYLEVPRFMRFVRNLNEYTNAMRYTAKEWLRIYVGVDLDSNEESTLAQKFVVQTTFLFANLYSIWSFYDGRAKRGLFDRSLLSTVVYNGGLPPGTQRDAPWLRSYDAFVVIVPPKDACLKRLRERADDDGFDRISQERYDEISQKYVDFASRCGRAIVLTDDCFFDWSPSDYAKFVDKLEDFMRDGRKEEIDDD